MLVSVVIPTFNRARMIGPTIESVLGQTHPNVELVVVDDGSTDDTEAVITRYAASSPFPIRYFKKPNGGCASARNAGAAVASGGFVAFLDSDDLWEPYAAEGLSAMLEATGADFVYSPATEVMVDGVEIPNPPSAAGRPESFSVEHFMDTNARPGSVLYRRRVLDRVRFDESLRYNEDSDFLQRVSMEFTAAYFGRPTSRIVHHADNKSANRVEIYRALLRSSERLLSDYPEFARALGGRADGRLREIKACLAEALIIKGGVAEARELAVGLGGALRFPARLALIFGSAKPLWGERLLRIARYRLALGIKRLLS